MRVAGVEAFVLMGTVLTLSLRETIAQLAIQQGMACFAVIPPFVEAGELLSYSPHHAESVARVASMVDRILRGAKPAEMPFEYPSRYELVVNLKTAKAIGVSLSQSILLRADRVVE